MAKVVPKVINSVLWFVVEIFLLTFRSLKIPESIQAMRKLFICAMLLLVHLSYLIGRISILSLNKELIVSTPFSLKLSVRSNLLHKPDSKVSLGWHCEYLSHFIVALLAANVTSAITRWTHDSFNILRSSGGFLFGKLWSLIVTIAKVRCLCRIILLVSILLLSVEL